MKEFTIGSVDGFVNGLLDALNETNEVRFNPLICGGNITRKKVVKTIITTTYTLVEDEQLIKDLVEFCSSRYTYGCRHITETKVNQLLKCKSAILDIYKYDGPNSEYVYVMNHPDIYNYRWEGDYCPDAEPTVRRYSFSDVLDEFIELHPDKCRWTETAVETKIVEE